MLQEELFTDVNLVFKDGTQLASHRCILSSQSNVFKTMIDEAEGEEMKEGAVILEISDC